MSDLFTRATGPLALLAAACILLPAGDAAATSNEACCFDDGTCVDVDADNCTGAGGTPQGPGTECATASCPQPTEACCLADGSCTNLGFDACNAMSGLPQGPETDCATTTCDQPEACCYGDGSCTNVAPLHCALGGGAAEGPGTDCATTVCLQPLEACCFLDGTCSDLTTNDCAVAGGAAQGFGSACATVTCAPLIIVITNVVRQAANEVAVEWDATNGVTYRLQSTTNLADDPSTWINVGPPQIGPPGRAIDSNANERSKIYRVILQ